MFVIKPTFIPQIIASSKIIFFSQVLNISTNDRVWRDRVYQKIYVCNLHICIIINDECRMAESFRSSIKELHALFSNISGAIHFREAKFVYSITSAVVRRLSLYWIFHEVNAVTFMIIESTIDRTLDLIYIILIILMSIQIPILIILLKRFNDDIVCRKFFIN